MTKTKWLFLATILLSCGLAQLMDYLVYLKIPEGSGVQVLPFLELRHIRNHGGVFGILQGHGWIFTGFAILVMVLLIGYLIYSEPVEWYKYLCYGLIAGGAISNIIDRFVYGSVIDYINVQGIPYWHYIFNTADTLIHLGLWPLVVMSILEERKEARQQST